MENYAKRILFLQDISAVGRCSMSVAVPVVTALGAECCMLPTALLSTHTGGFGDVAAFSAGDFQKRALRHFKAERIRFDGVCTGYLGTMSSAEAAGAALIENEHALKIVDPVCADNGRVYSSISCELLQKIKEIAGYADIIVPNITEAKLLLARPYDFATLTEDGVKKMCEELREKYSKRGIVTSVFTDKGYCNAIYDERGIELYAFKRAARGYPGCGDLFTSALAAIMLRGDVGFFDAAKYATNICTAAVETTAALTRETRFGLALERIMPRLTALKEYLDEKEQ